MTNVRSRVRCAAAVICLGLAVLATGCSSGPSTKEELCDAYSDYKKEERAFHPINENGVFRALKKLGDVAGRYPEDAEVQEAGPKLKKLGESDSFYSSDASRLARPISSECGSGS
ncbi:hypothetical protein GCM10027589_20240 [Actinocorallia lasiicapitis]